MAWWDHEELKSHADRSLRYKLNFFDEYENEEIIKSINEALISQQHVELALEVAKRIKYTPNYSAKTVQKSVTNTH